MKDAGFNMLRKHLKVEADRWYYHCDRLGMLVWQDMVSAAALTTGGKPATSRRCGAEVGTATRTPRTHQRRLGSDDDAYQRHGCGSAAAR